VSVAFLRDQLRFHADADAGNGDNWPEQILARQKALASNNLDVR
jgi:hypothetical protein